MTTPEHWQSLKQIVGQALECEPAQLQAFLDEACAGDTQLRAEVDSLLAAYQEAGGLSNHAEAVFPSGSGDQVPTSIGPYRLESKLGEGGMGQVWLAEQTAPVRRRVALKLIKAGMDTREVIARFETERQALALMDHPAIAKVFDAGSTLEGRPYFVMEYVAGLPITTFCDQHKLTVDQRLSLFIQVCDGVQHAHQKAIIHRDLKPSNILVSEVDGKPMPRIIDFGVAKAMSQDLDAETMFTQAGAMIGTLGYMSPEQAEPGSEDIDTRSDVYSLGVVLYELLVGVLPLDLKKVAYYEVLRQLREVDAPRPSTRLRELGKDSSVAAENRRVELPALNRQLRGDADSIALKALEKNRNRRYASASDFASDIERYLKHEPVLAHAPTAAYRTRKYVRRHRVGVSIAATGILLLIAFAIVQSIQIRNIRRQRDRADRITAFMSDMFKVSDPTESRGNTITAREILDKSSNQIESGLAQDPVVQTQLMQVMAATYLNLGLYTRAHSVAERVLAARRRTLGPSDPMTLESMAQLGKILLHERKSNEAEALLRTTIELEKARLGADNLLTINTENDLGGVLNNEAHYIEAEKIDREVVAQLTRKVGPNNPQTYAARNHLASALDGEKHFGEATILYQDLLESERRNLGIDHPYVLVTMHNYGNMLLEEGRHDEAEAMYRQALAIEQRVFGPEHPETASTMTTLANSFRSEHHRAAEAESMYRAALAIEMRTVGPDHGYTVNTKEGLANVLSTQGHYPEAQQLLEEVLATRQRTLGPHNTDTLLTGYNLASVELRQPHLLEAEKRIRETLALQSRYLDANDGDTLASETLLAQILLAENKLADAEQTARKSFEVQKKLLGAEHSDTQETLLALAEAMSRLNRYDEAKKLYLDTIAAINREPKGDPSEAWYRLAVLAAEFRHPDDAFDALRMPVASGYADAERLASDDDFKPLRKDPRFSQAMILARKQASMAKHS